MKFHHYLLPQNVSYNLKDNQNNINIYEQIIMYGLLFLHLICYYNTFIIFDIEIFCQFNYNQDIQFILVKACDTNEAFLFTCKR